MCVNPDLTDHVVIFLHKTGRTRDEILGLSNLFINLPEFKMFKILIPFSPFEFKHNFVKKHSWVGKLKKDTTDRTRFDMSEIKNSCEVINNIIFVEKPHCKTISIGGQASGGACALYYAFKYAKFISNIFVVNSFSIVNYLDLGLLKSKLAVFHGRNNTDIPWDNAKLTFDNLQNIIEKRINF